MLHFWVMRLWLLVFHTLIAVWYNTNLGFEMYRGKLFFCFTLLSVLLLNFVFCSAAKLDEEYIIGPEDSLSINVWENDDLTSHVQIRPDGKISLPLLDDIQAAGLTPLQLKEVITKRLESYVQNPKVTVIVTGIRNFTVYVQRGVNNASGRMGLGMGNNARGRSSYIFRKQASLWDLLTKIAPLDLTADLRHSFILRDGVKIPVDVYLLWVKKDLSQNIPLKPNDTLVLPNNYANRINVMGEVNAPQVIPYREGMKIVDAILAVGGFNDFGDDKRVIIIRKVAGEEVHMKVNVMSVMQGGEPLVDFNSGVVENVLLKPGDTIVVREWFFSMYRCLFFPY